MYFKSIFSLFYTFHNLFKRSQRLGFKGITAASTFTLVMNEAMSSTAAAHVALFSFDLCHAHLHSPQPDLSCDACYVFSQNNNHRS